MSHDLDHMDPQHHDAVAASERQTVEVFRSYLSWATDPALIAWATAKAQAAQMVADAEQALADAIRERQGLVDPFRFAEDRQPYSGGAA